MTAHVLCRFDELKPGTARRFEVGSLELCVVRIEDDLYCLGDICTHERVSLSDGEVYADEREIECWKHGSTFSLVDGEPQSLPATKPEPVYEVRREGDDVVVDLP